MPHTRKKPAVLCILDGWGYSENPSFNATLRPYAPVFWKHWDSCPHTLLESSGEAVGLPAEQMGNSEVGHMNIGAGRIVLQDLPRIDKAIANNELSKNPALFDFTEKLKNSSGVCHLMGLASTGGVHSHQQHIIALAKHLSSKGIPVAIHAFLDGRDVPPKSASKQIANLQKAISTMPNVYLASLCGRYYAMDRDKRWDRTEKAYDLLTLGEGLKALDPVSAIEKSYANGTTDEFTPPIVLENFEGIKEGDGILFANFRADRARQLLSAFLEPNFNFFPRKKTVNLVAAAGMVEYSEELNQYMSVLFPPQQIVNCLGEVISSFGLKQLRIAETEKYPHVTFFLNCGREEPFEGEERILVPSPNVSTYDLKPEMSAYEVTSSVISAIDSAKFDFIVINYANPDMVGHTGIMEAAVKAVKTVDECLGKLFEKVKEREGFVFLTADHGNCESMFDTALNSPQTAHTLSQVPLILFNSPFAFKKLKRGKLCDVAPTLLELMDLPKPKEMEGVSLVEK